MDTTSAGFFEAKYRADGDPWDYAGSAYEQGKYAVTMAALAGRRYRRAFEPGCSVGVLTERLAAICDAVEAIDFSPTAVAHARARCAHLMNVQVLCSSLPARVPVKGFDLVVLSEIGYYFGPEVWREMSGQMVEAMEPGSVLLGVHWLGVSADHCMSGDEVHEILRGQSMLRLEHAERCGDGNEGFRLDRWVRV